MRPSSSARLTGVDPDDPATARQACHASATTPRSSTRTRSTARRSGSGRRDGHVRWRSGRPEVDAIMQDTIDDARSPGCDGRRGRAPHQDTSSVPSSRRCCASSRRTSRTYLETYTGAGYPKTLAGADRVQQGQPGPRGPVELADLPSNDAATRRSRTRAAACNVPLAAGSDPGRAGAARRPAGGV